MTNVPTPISVCIIADDLTGACDAAIAFSRVGMSVEVEPAWSIRGISRSQVVAWNTESRDIDPGESTARLTEAASQLLGNETDYLFKKIDSVFRGNTFTEIACFLSVVPHTLAVLAPAFPELGRTLKDGCLYSSDLAGESTLAVQEKLVHAGVISRKIAAGASLTDSVVDALQAGAKVLLCDSQTQQDLVEIVRATLALNISGRILWIGSGGLAHALATNLRSTSVSSCSFVPEGEVLFLIGSNHAATRKQVAHLKLAHPECAVLPITRNISAAALREMITPYLTTDVSCVFATGGDTALAVCRAMEITRLQLQCEFERGLPQCRITGGPLDGSALILKSGGFGDEDILSRIAQAFSTKKEKRSA